MEELEGPTTRIYDNVLGLWGEKKGEDWQQMLAQGESFPAKKKKKKKLSDIGIAITKQEQYAIKRNI